MRKLNFELIPENMWYCNLRHILTKKQWDEIRKVQIEKHECKCAICNRKVKKLECHELWNFDEENSTQTLIDVIPLCGICHRTIHIGHAAIIGKLEECLDYYCSINKCTEDECIKDYEAAFKIWNERNKIKWKLNIEWINNILKTPN